MNIGYKLVGQNLSLFNTPAKGKNFPAFIKCLTKNIPALLVMTVIAPLMLTMVLFLALYFLARKPLQTKLYIEDLIYEHLL